MKLKPWSNSDIEIEMNKLLDQWSEGIHSLSSQLIVFLLLVALERLDRNFEKDDKR
jgi:hypothetical protein